MAPSAGKFVTGSVTIVASTEPLEAANSGEDVPKYSIASLSTKVYVAFVSFLVAEVFNSLAFIVNFHSSLAAVERPSCTVTYLSPPAAFCEIAGPADPAT